MGQGSRAELTQAAAEELRLDPGRIRLIMADTGLVPDDGTTAGSGSTPRTIPSVRTGRPRPAELLVDLAAKRWKVEPDDAARSATARSTHEATQPHDDLRRAGPGGGLRQGVRPADPGQRRVDAGPASGRCWALRSRGPNRRDIVTGAHHYPSDIVRPGMLHGKILRPPAFGATLVSIDLGPGPGDGGRGRACATARWSACAAPTALQAQRAVEALAKTAKWQTEAAACRARSCSPICRKRRTAGSVAEPLRRPSWPQAKKVLHESYKVAYIQHAPMETRAAVAEWDGGKLTVWTGTQNPFGVRGELAARTRAARRERARDRARHGRRFRRQAHGRSGGRGGPPGPGGQAARLAALDARGGVHLGLFPSGGLDRRSEAAWTRPARCASGTSSTSTPAARASRRRTASAKSQTPLRRRRRAAAAGLLPGLGRHGQHISPASRSWTSWPPRPGPIRWRSAWPT